MSPAVPLPELQQAIEACEHLLRNDRLNAGALCEVGLALRRLNRPAESRKCERAAVDALLYAIKICNVDAALSFEILIHNAFVATIEDDDHYIRSYARWSKGMAELGRRFRDPTPRLSTNPRRIAFVLASGTMLGHTEVLFRLARERAALEALGVAARVYVLYGYSREFVERAMEAGVEVSMAEDDLPERRDAPELARLAWLRARLRSDDCGVAVWVSAAPASIFMLSAGIAAVQIFWSLRFHPVSGPYIDGRISYGPPHERTKLRGKTPWQVCPVPLALDLPPHDASAIAAIRDSIAQPVLIGTLARPEKIDSKPFLAAVVRILKDNPDTAYLWTGRTRHPGIQQLFESAGIADRCHFVGWVDTVLYARALDVFLETFPLGCGVTGYQALGVGTALLSYREENTVFGMQFGMRGEAATAAPDDPAYPYPLLRARNVDEYVALASRLVRDERFRADTAERGQAFYRAEIANGERYATRFFETVIGIADATLAARTARAAS